MTKDDAWALSERPAQEITTVPATELITEPVADLPAQPTLTPVDPKQALRERIEAEELAKIEEERMRAEVRSRLLGQQVDVTAVPAPQAAPAPVIVNITNANTNTNTNTATATVGTVAVARKHPDTIWRLLYFLFFGWWIGPIWVGVALLFCISVVGLPIGLLMLSKALDSFIL